MPLSLKANTNLTFALALATLAVIGCFSFRESRGLVEEGRLMSHALQVLEVSESLASHLAEAAASRAAYFRLGDKKQIDIFNSASNSALSDVAKLRKLTEQDASQNHRVAGLEPLVQARLSVLKASVELHQRTTADLKEQDSSSEQGARLS